MAQPSDKALAFIAANKRSPVVSGVAIGHGGEGAVYTLQNGRSFRLSKTDCQIVGIPRWKLPRRKMP